MAKITLNWPDSVPKDQVSREFIQGMLDRMAVGFHNYNHVKLNFGPGGIHNAVKCLELRLKKFKETKNTEFLMDAANYCMIEHMFRQTKGAHFRATSKDESPGSVTKDGIVKGKEDDPAVQAVEAVKRRLRRGLID